MSITKSYNKYTKTYYAYENTKEFDENTNKIKIKRKCIGHYDPETNEIVPNNNKREKSNCSSMSNQDNSENIDKNIKHNLVSALNSQLDSIERSVSIISDNLKSFRKILNIFSETEK